MVLFPPSTPTPWVFGRCDDLEGLIVPSHALLPVWPVRNFVLASAVLPPLLLRSPWEPDSAVVGGDEEPLVAAMEEEETGFLEEDPRETLPITCVEEVDASGGEFPLQADDDGYKKKKKKKKSTKYSYVCMCEHKYIVSAITLKAFTCMYIPYFDVPTMVTLY